MKIKTAYYPPPIPIRNCDWCAYEDGTLDGDYDYESGTYGSCGGPQGWGTTEQEAIQNLLEQIEERA
jgi:hypothetical protein